MVDYLSPGVYVEEKSGGARPIEGVATAIAAFVGFSDIGPLNDPVRITSWPQFVDIFGGGGQGHFLAQAVHGYFSNGGTTCYTVRIGEGHQGGETPTGRQKQCGTFLFATRDSAASDSSDLQVEVQRIQSDVAAKGRKSAAKDNSDATEPHSPEKVEYRIIVKGAGKTAETLEVSTDPSSPAYAVKLVEARSKHISLTEVKDAGTPALPDAEEFTLTSAPPATGAGSDEISLVNCFIGDATGRTGLACLEAVDEVTSLLVPDVMSAFQAGRLDRQDVKAIQIAMISHCEGMANRIAVIDPLPDLGPADVHEWRQSEAGYDSKYAVLYYPWIRVTDLNTGKGVLVPPSGGINGVWARSDSSRGVHKAPANEVILGATDLALQLTRTEQEQLNPAGINCIRSFPGRGIRVWGARTLSSDPEWRYLNIRRLFNFLEESIYQGTQWAVFEPNDERLWSTITRTIESFLRMQWRSGALAGSSEADAFFVHCNASTNPPDVIDAGQVVCEVGVAPVKPAEFVIFRISQSSGE